jgi:multidrug transporter EmrE-like cation transporter
MESPRIVVAQGSFGATSIVVVNALGVLLLGEILSIHAYLAIGLVVLGFITLALSP